MLPPKAISALEDIYDQASQIVWRSEQILAKNPTEREIEVYIDGIRRNIDELNRRYPLLSRLAK